MLCATICFRVYSLFDGPPAFFLSDTTAIESERFNFCKAKCGVLQLPKKEIFSAFLGVEFALI